MLSCRVRLQYTSAGMYPSSAFMNLSIASIIEHPATWGAAGFIVGLALGVNLASVWLMAFGLAAFVYHLWRSSPPEHSTEGMRFASGPLMVVGWMLGFVVHGLAF